MHVRWLEREYYADAQILHCLVGYEPEPVWKWIQTEKIMIGNVRVLDTSTSAQTERGRGREMRDPNQ